MVPSDRVGSINIAASRDELTPLMTFVLTRFWTQLAPTVGRRECSSFFCSIEKERANKSFNAVGYASEPQSQHSYLAKS